MPGATPSPGASERRAEFEQLVLPIVPELRRAAKRLVRPPLEAMDLIQDTLLRAYRTFDNFETGTNAKAWLFTILYSVAANAADKERRHPVVQSDGGDERFAAALDRVPSEELALLSRLDGSPVEAAVKQLPEEFRSAVLLVDLEELTYEGAASVLKCPVGTLRSRLFRGRKLLFLALHEYARETGLVKDR